MNMSQAQLSIRLPEELHRRARVAAAVQGESLSRVLRRALEDYVYRVLGDTGLEGLAGGDAGEVARLADSSTCRGQRWRTE